MAEQERRKQREKLARRVSGYIDAGEKKSLTVLLNKQRSSDIAEITEVLDHKQRRAIFDVLDKDLAAECLEKVTEATRRELFEIFSNVELVALFSHLDLDDVADLLSELPEDQRWGVLTKIAPADSVLIKKLISYPEDSAGGIMDPVVLSVYEDATVAEAIEKIRAAEFDEDFYSVYVVNKTGTFIGDVRIRLLLTRPVETRISKLADINTIYVLAEDDQERVRNIFSKNDLIVVPVLNDNHKLIGRITADRIIEVAEEEAAEDMYAMAGTEPEELEKFSALHAARIRLTWLLPCLIGTGITALVLMFFSGQFGMRNLSLVYTAAFAFVPMIAAISGNAGLQTSTIVISGLATGHLAALKLRQVFTREIRIALLVAMTCGVLGGLACGMLLDSQSAPEAEFFMRITFAFGVAMFSAIMVATTLGLFLPFLFRRIGIDPAISSGPLVTTANDSLSVLIYMTLILALAAW